MKLFVSLDILRQTNITLCHFLKRLWITSPRDQVENFDMYANCKNRETTSYYGIAYSKAFIEGK